MESKQLPEYLVELLPSFLSALRAHNLEKPVKSPEMEEGLTKMVKKFHPDKCVKGPHIRLIVRYLRRKGYPIGSGSTGYFWAKNKAEWEVGLKNLRSRALDELTTYNQAKRIIIENEKFNLQSELFPETAQEKIKDTEEESRELPVQ